MSSRNSIQRFQTTQSSNFSMTRNVIALLSKKLENVVNGLFQPSPLEKNATFDKLNANLFSSNNSSHFNLSELESELTVLFETYPKNQEAGQLVINTIEKKLNSLAEKKIAYRIFVKVFNIDSYEKFASYPPNEIFAIESAKIAARNRAFYIDHFRRVGIKDERALIEIAKISAQHGGNPFYFSQYQIKNQTAIIENAQISAGINGNRLSACIHSYGIQDEIALFNVFFIALKSSCGKAFEHYREYKFSDKMVFDSDNIQGYTNPNLKDSFEWLSQEERDFSRVSRSLNSFCISQGWLSLEKIFEKILQKDPIIQKKVWLWLTYFLGISAQKKISSEQFEFILQSGCFNAVLNYADPKMRFQLANILIEVVKNQAGREYASSLLKIKQSSYAKVPLLLLATLYSQGVDHKVCSRHLEAVLKSDFRDGKNLRIYVNAMHIILESKELNAEDKQYLLLQIDQQNLMPILYSIKTLEALNKMPKLKKINLESTTISNLLHESMQQLIPTDNKDNFLEQYTKYFSETRVPNFILTYAATFRSDKELSKILGFGIDGILDGAFPKMRYNIEKSRHLRIVFFEKPDLFSEWQKGEKAPLGNFLEQTDNEIKTIDFYKIFEENLIGHRHLKTEDAPLLFNFLKQTHTYEEILKEIDEQLQSSEKKSILNIQKNCLKLTLKCLSLDDQKHLLKEIESDLKIVICYAPQFKEFQNDIKSLLSGLINQNLARDNYNKFTIEDTDNYIDLFLCGTEVGSCQSIDAGGSNVCLMASVFDGKIRLLAIKDKEGKIIARNIFRIMWNGSEPVLFIERTYPLVVDPKLQHALDAFAIRRAQKMSLTLLKQDPSKIGYHSPIFSLGTLEPVRYEYTDASRIGQTDGKYTINSSNVVFAPQKIEPQDTVEKLKKVLGKNKPTSE